MPTGSHRDTSDATKTRHTSDSPIPYTSLVKTFAQHVSDYIEGQGHKTDITPSEDGIVTAIGFRTRGIWMTAVASENDRGYLQISCTFPIPEYVEIDRSALEILLATQDRVKAIKFSAIDEDRLLVGNIELLFAGDSGFEPVFWQSVGIIESTMRETTVALEENCVAKTAADRFIKTLSLGGSK